MASLVLGAVGGAVGYAIGGPVGAQVGFALGSAAGGVLFPPKGPDGPRLNDLAVQSSAYGQTIPILYGTDRIAGNVIWAAPIQEHAHEEGGKGGPTYTTYSYTASFAAAIGQGGIGPIAGVLRIWADGLLIFDRRPTAVGEELGFRASSYKVYTGTEDQLPDPTIQALQGETPAYRGLAYVVFTDLQLEKFGNRIPSLTFEYVTSGTEVVPATTTFGEHYGLGTNSSTFGADMDSNGHIWLHTMTGHAWMNPITGVLEISAGAPVRPQIQEYDARTGELIWYYDVPSIAEQYDPDTPPNIVYPIRGEGIYSGGFYFIGRGSPGWPASRYPASAYCHGLAVNTQTRAVSQIYDECSSGQFQNAFYWPTVPVPVIDNNKVYFASGNGLQSDAGIGFFPASFINSDGLTIFPVPDRSGPEPMWSAPLDWAQVRRNMPCPYPPRFDGTALLLPGWAFKSQLVRNPDAVIVQGYGGSGTYLAYIAHSPPVDGEDYSAPSSVLTCELPGSSVTMPAVAWDSINECLWAFAGENGAMGDLYSISFGGSGVDSTGGLTPTYTGYSMPNLSGDSQGKWVKGMTFDDATGYLRLIVGGGFDNVVNLVLFDPMTQTIIEERVTGTYIAGTTGKMWDVPGANKAIYADGFRLYSVPYGSPLIPNAVSLGAIVGNVSQRVGLSADDFDVSELTDQVAGFTVTRQMAGRSAIEALMPVYFFDVAESDYRVKFPKRGRPVAFTIPDEDLAAHPAGAGVPDLVQVKRKQEVDLPQTVAVKYKDIEADYQTGTQYERRMAGRSQSDVTVDLPIAMTAEKAKQVAAAALYSAWAERTGLTFATSLAYATLEPTDMAIVHGRLVRIVHRKRNGGVLEWEAYADGNSIYSNDTTNQGGTAAPSAPVGQVIKPIPATRLIAIDAPIMRDGTTGPIITFAVQGLDVGWAGAQIFKSVDGGLSYQPVANAPTASLIGAAQTVLGPYLGGNTFDEINTVRVSLLPSSTGATLASATELAVLNGANAALLGDEVLQYKRAVLNSDGTYTLSGLLRYRRGTDYATHAAGERFVPLSASLIQLPMSTSEIGLPRQYKAVSNGGTLSQAQPVTLTYQGIDLKPYAPVHVGGWRATDGGLTLTWVRRTRVGGEWRDGVDAPLSESGEAYEVEVMNGAAVVRTITGLSSPTVVYSAAQQVEDFGALQASVVVRVYQLSSVVGRGFPGIGTV